MWQPIEYCLATTGAVYVIFSHEFNDGFTPLLAKQILATHKELLDKKRGRTGDVSSNGARPGSQNAKKKEGEAKREIKNKTDIFPAFRNNGRMASWTSDAKRRAVLDAQTLIEETFLRSSEPVLVLNGLRSNRHIKNLCKKRSSLSGFPTFAGHEGEVLREIQVCARARATRASLSQTCFVHRT